MIPCMPMVAATEAEQGAREWLMGKLGPDGGVSERDKWLSGDPSFHSMKARYSYEWARERFYRVVSLALPYVRRKNVLDIGCAEGWYAQYFAVFAHSVIGIDADARLIKQACQDNKEENAFFEPMSWEHMPDFKDGRFDFALMSECLEHSINAESAINEVSRVSALTLYTVPIAEIPGAADPDHKHFWRIPDMQQLFARLTMLASDGVSAYCLVRGDHARIDGSELLDVITQPPGCPEKPPC